MAEEKDIHGLTEGVLSRYVGVDICVATRERI